MIKSEKREIKQGSGDAMAAASVSYTHLPSPRDS